MPVRVRDGRFMKLQTDNTDVDTLRSGAAPESEQGEHQMVET